MNIHFSSGFKIGFCHISTYYTTFACWKDQGIHSQNGYFSQRQTSHLRDHFFLQWHLPVSTIITHAEPNEEQYPQNLYANQKPEIQIFCLCHCIILGFHGQEDSRPHGMIGTNRWPRPNFRSQDPPRRVPLGEVDELTLQLGIIWWAVLLFFPQLQ